MENIWTCFKTHDNIDKHVFKTFFFQITSFIGRGIFALVLGRYGGAMDLAIASPVANRNGSSAYGASRASSLVCPSSELRRRVDTTDIQNSFEIQCQHKYHKWTRIVLRNWKDFIVSLCFFSFFILRLTLYSCRPAVEPLIGYFVPVAQLSVFQEDSASYIQLGRNTVIFRVAMQSGSFEEPWGYFPRLCREFLRLSVWRKKQCDDFQSRRLHTFREQSVTWEPRKGDTTDTHVHRKLAYL